MDVRLDAAAGTVVCEDDGCGIAPADLRLAGQRYCSSKTTRGGSLGYRGEALSSLCAVAVVKLNTQAEGEAAHTKWVRAGQAEAFLPEPRARGVGTTVTVRELFHNLPVRQQALRATARRELQAARVRLTRLALSHPGSALSLSPLPSAASGGGGRGGGGGGGGGGSVYGGGGTLQPRLKLLQTRRVLSARQCFAHLYGDELAQVPYI